MPRLMITLFVLSAVLSMGDAWAENEKEAEGLASTAVELIGMGKVEKGREFLYKALGYDPSCGVALHELAKLLEADGKTASAADFLSRAVVELSGTEKTGADRAARRSDAQRRLQRLNPYAMQLTLLMEEYAQELTRIAKKNPDSMTAEEANNRVAALQMASYLPAGKLPDLPKAAEKTSTAEGARPASEHKGRSRRVRRNSNGNEIVTEVAPDAERALKAAGWNSITGIWKKKSEGVYEVTDGMLEANKLNGGVQVSVLPGSTAVIKVFVRFMAEDSDYYYSSSEHDFEDSNGIGMTMRRLRLRMYYATTSTYSGRSYPRFDRESNLTEGSKTHLAVTVQENRLDYFINGKKERNYTYPIPKEGTFAIVVNGTATLEAPKAVGQ